MIIEVVLSEVCENGGIKFNGTYPILNESVAGYLHGHGPTTTIDHVTHEGLEIDGFGSGMRGRYLIVANHVFHCSDQAASHEGRIEQMLDKKSGGRFAVRTCNAHRFEAERGMRVERRGDIRHGLPGIRYNHQWAIVLRQGFFGNDGGGALFSRLRGKCGSIMVFSRKGKEKTPLFGLARVIAKRSDFGVGEPLRDS